MSQTQTITKEQLLADFREKFGDGGDIRVYFAPGRVNLIGEHTDYNGGAAMPGALNLGTYFAARKRDDTKLRMYSENFPQDSIVEADLADLKKDGDSWTNYPKGVIWAFEEKGYKIPTGLDLFVWGNIPNGAGLSSSASVEVGMGTVLRDLFSLDVSNEDLAHIGQFAENRFNGVNCGIMDQFAIAMGKDGHVIFLTTSPLDYEYAPIDLGDAKIVIASSNKRRGLGDSKYNERRAQCEQALRELQTEVSAQTLCDLTEEEFEAHKGAISSEELTKRAKHAVSENARTKRAKAALENGDIALFGQLMKESHNSLRDDYEVTGIELDTLVDAANRQAGVIGARMTGAGFGGCTVNIVKEKDIPAFIENVGREYRNTIGYDADFFTVEIGDGPRRI